MHWEVCWSHCTMRTAVQTPGTYKHWDRSYFRIRKEIGRKKKLFTFQNEISRSFEFFCHYLKLNCSWMQFLLSVPCISVQLYRLLSFILQDSVITLYVCRIYINNPKISPLQCRNVLRISEKAAVRFSNMDFTRIYLLPNRITISTLFVIISIAVCNGDCKSTKG
jgi:hypothetical protein